VGGHPGAPVSRFGSEWHVEPIAKRSNVVEIARRLRAAQAVVQVRRRHVEGEFVGDAAERHQQCGRIGAAAHGDEEGAAGGHPTRTLERAANDRLDTPQSCEWASRGNTRSGAS
jgi:hypothetical protein